MGFGIHISQFEIFLMRFAASARRGHREAGEADVWTALAMQGNFSGGAGTGRMRSCARPVSAAYW